MMKFGGVGLVNTLTDFLGYAVLLAAGAAPLIANAFGFAAANAQSYLLNSQFTFREAGRAAQAAPAGYARFLAAHLASLAISTAMIALFADALGPIAAKAVAALFTFVWNYAASAIFVFRRRRAPVSGEAAP